MRLRVGGKRARLHDCPGAGVCLVGGPGDEGASIALELVSQPDADNRGRPRVKVRLEIDRAELVDTSDPTLSAVVRHLVLMLESAGIDWRANRYLESDGEECETCAGVGKLRDDETGDLRKCLDCNGEGKR